MSLDETEKTTKQRTTDQVDFKMTASHPTYSARHCLWHASLLALLFMTAARLCALQSYADTIRSKADMRLWQTAHDRLAPLEWPWEDGADSAALTFSNRVTYAVSFVAVQRGEGETRGSCACPLDNDSIDVAFDVSLVQMVGAREVARESATVAYVSGAAGVPITVQAPGTRGWSRVDRSRVVAFDPAWIGEEGDSGYDVVRSNYVGFRIIVR